MNKSEMILLDGEVVKGHQIASGKAADTPYPGGSIPLQMPYFARLGLDLSGFYPGTLNISIAPKSFKLRQADYCFENINWIEGFPAETFSFCRCILWFQGTPLAGFIYYPHPETKTQHFHNDSLLEILCPKIDDITYGDKVRLELRTEQVDVF